MNISIKMDSAALTRHLQAIERRAGRTAEEIVNTGSMLGASQAQALVIGGSGELRSSIAPLSIQAMSDGAKGGWGTISDHAGFVEFGTGAPGLAGSVTNGQQRSPMGGSYSYTTKSVIASGPNEGKIIDGWVYYDEVRGQFVHTYGQPARPFMYPAQLFVERELLDIARLKLRHSLGGI